MQDKWVIVGCGGHARSIADVILDNNQNASIIFLDKNAKSNEKLLGFPVFASYNITNENVIIGIGDNLKRKELSIKYYSNLSNVISKRSYIAKSVNLGKGIFVAHHAHIGVLSKINDFVIVNTGVNIDHECVLDTASSVAPNVTLCGKVHLNENVFLGACATVLPNIKICANSIIGAGTIVIDNINISGTYVGNPMQQKL